MQRSQYSQTNYNTAVGVQAMQGISGQSNVVAGYQAMFGPAGGVAPSGPFADYNVVLGANAATGLWSGTGNVILGASSVNQGANTLNNSTIIGYQAAPLLQESGNTIIGYQAGQVYTSSGTAGYNSNVIVGYQSATMLSTGAGNTIIGVSAAGNGSSLVTGNGNVLIGYKAALSSTSYDFNNSIVIGQSSSYGNNGVNGPRIVIGSGVSGIGDNAITLGNSSTNMDLIYTTQAFDATSDAYGYLYLPSSNTNTIPSQAPANANNDNAVAACVAPYEEDGVATLWIYQGLWKNLMVNVGGTEYPVTFGSAI